ncbi:F0F1 ATP synthase subunit delta [Hoyosella sp. YIM 151337]|uniref:F0F1 ATP synthase subunit delta n=1 Tax=Hoyosella sp. YIM 151337 TaxID=2992742 RepID=UPI002236B924|nr:F0F1 ATP synthase subunit delta [Hoyosella sp. YIM 151337]MCW4355183.1 F0F1 ATP synthase subunit delta [Hoyosella sp. YIM 151337]
MYAASREALAKTQSALTDALSQAGSSAETATEAGAQLFSVVGLLDENRSVRTALTDVSVSSSSRSALAEQLFTGKVSGPVVETLKTASAQDWSAPADFVNSLVHVARVAYLRAAADEEKLDTVEDEIFRLSRITAANPELEQALSDRSRPASATAEVLKELLYGKVTPITEALAAQAVARSRRAPADEFAEIASLAAEQRERAVAHVRSSVALSDSQKERLATALDRIYGKRIAVHVEVDPSLLSGLVVRVGDEVIDGSAAGRLAALRKALK